MNMGSASLPSTSLENDWLAPYAMRDADSAGRQVPEPVHPYRGAFQRDRDRLLHSSAFRHLSYKTQVFTGELGDYHRTRLTHTLEVASIARTVARVLRINEDLVEALSLAHDIGHPPFGHAGEELLNERLSDHGGFNHNRQGLRILERLERRYPDRPGLNLTAEVLEGQGARGDKPPRDLDCLTPGSFPNAEQWAPLLEVQVVDAADRIAYDAHDADDALQIGMITIDELAEAPIWLQAVDQVKQRYPGIGGPDLRRAVVHAFLNNLVEDLVATTQERLTELRIDSIADVRSAGILVAPSKGIDQQQAVLESLLFTRVYRHPLVLQRRAEATGALASVFDQCLGAIPTLPEAYLAIAHEDSAERAVADYLSGMTDRAILSVDRKQVSLDQLGDW